MTETDAHASLAPLLAAAGRGDGAAFNELYRRFAPRVKAFALTRSVDDPDALANDVMLKVFQHLGAFEGTDDQFVSWLFTIARNRIIDLHRAAKRRPPIVDDEVPDVEAADSAEHVAFERLGLDRTVELLDLLTDDQRDVVALRMIADLSLDEVARVVDKPVTAVKALQRRGLQRLQKEILRQGVSR